MDLLIALFDYMNLNKFFRNSYTQKKERHLNINLELYSLFTVLLLAVSSQNALFHFVMILFAVIITSMFYEEVLSAKIVFLLIYLLSRVISKWISLDIINIFWNLQAVNQRQHFRTVFESLLFCILHCLFISALCKWKNKKKEALPKYSTKDLSLLIRSIGICCLINFYIVKCRINNNIHEILCMLLSLISVYHFMFLFFYKQGQVFKLSAEKKLLIQDTGIKELYYKEVEESNQQLRRLQHDFKNQLLSFYYFTEKDTEAARKSIQAMFTEWKVTDCQIKTKNSALYSICSVKFAMAKERGISAEYQIRIPEKISMNYEEMGVLYGNLLDNAIEACEKAAKEERYLVFTTKLSGENLIIYLKNSKAESVIGSEIGTSGKQDRKNHGMGLKSIRKIVTRYHGIMKINEENKYFTVKILLYGIKSVTQEEEKGIQYSKIT